MKPDWDKLMSAFKGHASTLVADVDCTAGGKSLCEEVGVRGYPTIKHGDPNDLQDYKGGRDSSALTKFANELGPQCSPSNIELCEDAKKAQIKEFMAMGTAERETLVETKEAELKQLETELSEGETEKFEKFSEIQKHYTEAIEKKDKDIDSIKVMGLNLLKSVHAHVKKTGSSEL